HRRSRRPDVRALAPRVVLQARGAQLPGCDVRTWRKFICSYREIKQLETSFLTSQIGRLNFLDQRIISIVMITSAKMPRFNDRHGMPPAVAAGVMPQLVAAAAAARLRLGC